MFDFLRKKETPVPPASGKNPGEEKAKLEVAKWAALKSAIDAQKAADPLIGPKIGAKEVNKFLMSGLKNEKGIHLESFLTVLGSLAGFVCQMSVREEIASTEEGPREKIVWTREDIVDGKTEENSKMVKDVIEQKSAEPGDLPKKIPWVIVNGADGKKYHFGDALNKPLAENQYSIWSLAAGTAQHLGATVPNVNEIFQHVAATVGGDTFGVPRIPDNHRPGDLPLNYLKVIWPRVFPLAAKFCEKPSEWPILFGLAIQEAITMGKDIIDPTLAVTIVMECAIPMSKVDLPEFYRTPNPY